MVDPRDLGHTLGDRKDAESAPSKGVYAAPGFDPTLFVYDRMPGGVGLAPRLFEQRDELMARVLGLLHGCTCDSGCPSCVGPTMFPNAAQHTAVSGQARREIAVQLLSDLGLSSPQ
jgi:DEAD/DEAH box helicase domain-containing protein